MSWKDDLGMRLIVDNGSRSVRFGRADPESGEPLCNALNMMATHKKSGEASMLEDLEGILDESAYKYSKPHVWLSDIRCEACW